MYLRQIWYRDLDACQNNVYTKNTRDRAPCGVGLDQIQLGIYGFLRNGLTGQCRVTLLVRACYALGPM